jgi:hypothetical protein
MYRIVRDSHPITVDEFRSLAEKFPKLKFSDDKSRNICTLSDTENFEYPMKFDDNAGEIIIKNDNKITKKILLQIIKIADHLDSRVVDENFLTYNDKIINGYVHSNDFRKVHPINYKQVVASIINVWVHHWRYTIIVPIIFYLTFTELDIAYAIFRARAAPGVELQQQIGELKSNANKMSLSVNIMATPEFDPAMARRLADKLARDTGLRISLRAPFWLGTAAADADSRYEVSTLLEMARQERSARNLTDPHVPLIILTSVSMLNADSPLDAEFEAYNAATGIGYVSIQPMNQRDFLWRTDVLGEYRMAVYMKRMVGRLLFGLPTNEDAFSFMFRRVLSAHDIDRMAHY